MPLRIPKESLITIQKRSLPADFAMPQMEVAETHYSIIFRQRNAVYQLSD